MISWWYRDDIVLYLIHKSDQICIWIYIWSSSVLRFFVFWHGSVWHASVCQKGAADEPLRGCLTLNPENPSPAPYRHGADPKDTAHRSLIARQRLHERWAHILLMQKSAPVSAWHASGYVWEELTQGLLVPPWGKKKKIGNNTSL